QLLAQAAPAQRDRLRRVLRGTVGLEQHRRERPVVVVQRLEEAQVDRHRVSSSGSSPETRPTNSPLDPLPVVVELLPLSPPTGRRSAWWSSCPASCSVPRLALPLPCR